MFHKDIIFLILRKTYVFYFPVGPLSIIIYSYNEYMMVKCVMIYTSRFLVYWHICDGTYYGTHEMNMSN